MMAWRTGSTTLVSFLAATAAAAPALAMQRDGDVRFSIYSDVAAVAPGSIFHLAFEYTIQEDWHIYWLNPGDMGMPTTVEIKAPEGFAVGPVRFPGPHRIEDAGVVSFGYEGAATLVAEIKAPATLKPGEALRFDIRSDWLVCKQSCVLGSAEKSITLKAATSAASTPSPDAARFARAETRLPRPLKEFKIGKAKWSGGGDSPRFEATVPRDVEIEFFPLLVEGVETGAATVEELPDGSSRLAVAFDVDVNRLGPAGPPSVGVLRVKKGDEETFFDLAPPMGG